MNIKTLLGSALFIFILALFYGLANATDTEKTDWEQQAKQNWTAKYGDAPRKPTAEELAYMQNYTALLQAKKKGLSWITSSNTP